MKKAEWIGVDLDGTLAVWDGWRGIEHIGEPVEPMAARVRAWLAQGEEVRIFTARVDGGQAALAMGDENGRAHADVAAVKRHIEQWCLEHLGAVLPITNVKDYGMRELWDDRAIGVERNTGRRIGEPIPAAPEPARPVKIVDGNHLPAGPRPWWSRLFDRLFAKYVFGGKSRPSC